MHEEILDAFRALTTDDRFSDKYMDLIRDPGEGGGGFDQKIRVATKGDREIVTALEQFAAGRGLYSSTIEVGMETRSGPGAKMVMMIKRP